MNDSSLIGKALDLPEFEVLDIKQNDYEIWIFVRKKERPEVCMGCGTYHPHLHIKDHKHNVKSVADMGDVDMRTTVRDLSMFGKRTGLIIDQVKWECLECGCSFWETLDSVVRVQRQGRMTKRLRDFIAEEAKHRSFIEIELDLNISDTTIRKIFDEEIAKLPAYYEMETPKVLGIDEIFVQRPDAQSRKVAWAIIGNGDKRTCMELLPNRSKDTIIAFLTRLKNPENVRVVTMDMWNPYKDAVYTALPGAVVVVDKPHILRMPDNALRNTLREISRARLPQEEVTRLRKMARRLRTDFYRIYDCSRRHDAERTYEEWAESIPADKRLNDYRKLARTIKKWHTEVFNYFDHQYTNSFVERMNLTVRKFDLHSLGLDFKALRGKILFYTPRESEYRPPNFGTQGVQEMYYGNYKPLIYGVSFDEIDKLIDEKLL